MQSTVQQDSSREIVPSSQWILRLAGGLSFTHNKSCSRILINSPNYSLTSIDEWSRGKCEQKLRGEPIRWRRRQIARRIVRMAAGSAAGLTQVRSLAVGAPESMRGGLRRWLIRRGFGF